MTIDFELRGLLLHDAAPFLLADRRAVDARRADRVAVRHCRPSRREERQNRGACAEEDGEPRDDRREPH